MTPYPTIRLIPSIHGQPAAAPKSIHRLLAALALTTTPMFADAEGIDRVYHPYVTPLETELEWRGTLVDDDHDPDSDAEQLHRFAIGRSIGERLFGEVYINARKTDTAHLQVSGFELEGLYQLTEPGEYAFDWGVQVEYERDTDRNISDLGARLIAEKEIGATSLALNFNAEYEYGRGIKEELDVGASAQWRWRLTEAFEPALEYYMGDRTNGAGPVIVGMQRLGTAKKLKWELGVIFGVDSDTPERTWRGLIEFEF